MTGNVSFEDVLDALMLEEPTPSYATLLRWSERYPQYREALAQFFATWAIQADQPQQVALEILRRQGRLEPKASIEWLPPFDQLVLTATYLLRDKGDYVNIARKVSEISGTNVRLVSTSMSLGRLEAWRLVSSPISDPKTEPDGRTRRYFMVTIAGERALARVKETSKLLANFLEDFA